MEAVQIFSGEKRHNTAEGEIRSIGLALQFGIDIRRNLALDNLDSSLPSTRFLARQPAGPGIVSISG